LRKVESSSQKSKSSKRVVAVHKGERPKNNQRPELLLARAGLNKSQLPARSRAASAATAGGQSVAPMPDEVPPTSGLDITPAGQIFSGENPGKLAVVDTFADSISSAWYRTVDGILTTASLCAQADAQLSPEEKGDLLGRLPFGHATYSKLLGVGKDLRLQRPEIKPLLPPGYTILHLITTLTDDEFQLAVESNLIHAEVNRSAIEKWRRECRTQDRHGQVGQVDGADGVFAPTISAGPVAVEPEAEGESSPALVRSESQSGSNVPECEAKLAEGDLKSVSIGTPAGEQGPSAKQDCRAMSADEQRAFDAVVAAYDAAPEIVKDRFTSMVLQPAYGRRHVQAI
jgi:hypothetical protein